MISKDRINHQKGANNGRAKLTECNVRQIRSRYKEGRTQVALGKQFNVSESTIGAIVNNKTWKHVI